MYICILVCYMYRYTHEKFKCYLVQMMLTSHHRKISDSQPMIGLNEPKKSDNILEPTTTEPPYLHPDPFLLSSRKTSEVYIVCIDVVLYYVLCKLIRKKNKQNSIHWHIGYYQFFDFLGNKTHRPYFAEKVLLIRSNDL